jgi:hypothetical protein
MASATQSIHIESPFRILADIVITGSFRLAGVRQDDGFRRGLPTVVEGDGGS